MGQCGGVSSYCLSVSYLAAALVFTTVASADEDRAGQHPGLTAELVAPLNTRELRDELETCVGAIGFVENVEITPSEDEVIVETKVTNSSNFAISGLVVTVTDPDVLALGLDGRSILEFERLVPGESIMYVESVPSLRGHFD